MLSVVICEIIVHLLVIVQSNKRCTVQRIEIRKPILFISDGLYCKGPLCVRFFKFFIVFEVLILSPNDLVAFWPLAESA
jgi:hypothetical protein